MRTLLLLLPLLITGTLLKAQIAADKTVDGNDDMGFQQLIGENYSDQSFTNKGIYLRDSWLPGHVVLNSFDSIGPLMLRYNSFEDQLIWLSKKHGQVQLDKLNIKEFDLKSSDTVFHFKRLQLNPGKDTTDNFLEVGYEGRVRFYVFRKVKHFANYIERYTRYFIYKPDPQYFLVVENKTYQLNKANPKSLYKLFPDVKDKIHQRIRENHLVGKKESDFIQVLRTTEDILEEANPDADRKRN